MLTKAQADIAYNILVLHAGAHPAERESFVSYATRPHSVVGEYRFRGSLGFGGKFWFVQHELLEGQPCSVTCYPEDETPERLATITRVNGLLAQL